MFFIESYGLSSSFLSNKDINIDKKKIIRSLLDTIEPKEANENCLKIKDYSLFNLFGLSEKQYYIHNYKSGTLKYNFCKNVENENSSVIFIPKNDPKKKIRLSGNINGEKDNKNKVILEYHGNEENEGHNKTKIILKLATGDKCLSKKNSSEYYQFSFVFTCDKKNIKGIRPDYFQDIDINENCTFVMTFKSDLACGRIHHYIISLTLEKQIYIWGSGLVLFGLFFGICGYKTKKVSIVLSCTIVIPASVYLLIVKSLKISIALKISVLSVCLLLGIGIGVFFSFKMRFMQIFMCILGGGLGYLLGINLSTIFTLVGIELNEVVFYLIIVGSVLIFALIGIFFMRHIFMVGTSAIGGYSIMRGIALLFKDKISYVDEVQIMDLAMTNNIEVLSEVIKMEYFIYPSIFVINTGIFSFIQYKINPISEDEENYKFLEQKYEKQSIFSSERERPILPDGRESKKDNDDDKSD